MSLSKEDVAALLARYPDIETMSWEDIRQALTSDGLGSETFDQAKTRLIAEVGGHKPTQPLLDAAEHARQYLRLDRYAVNTVELQHFDADEDTSPDIDQDTVTAVLTRAINTGIGMSEVTIDQDSGLFDAMLVVEDGSATQYVAGELTDEQFAATIAHAAVEAALHEQAAGKAAHRAAVLAAVFNGAQVVSA